MRNPSGGGSSNRSSYLATARLRALSHAVLLTLRSGLLVVARSASAERDGQHSFHRPHCPIQGQLTHHHEVLELICLKLLAGGEEGLSEIDVIIESSTWVWFIAAKHKSDIRLGQQLDRGAIRYFGTLTSKVTTQEPAHPGSNARTPPLPAASIMIFVVEEF